MFKLKAKLSAGTGSYYVDTKPPRFPMGTIAEKGLKGMEGPYPQWALGKVRWSEGDRFEVTVPCSAPSVSVLVEARGSKPNNSLTLTDGLTGKKGASVELSDSKFNPATANLTCQDQRARLVGQVTGQPQAGPVLIQKMQFSEP